MSKHGVTAARSAVLLPILLLMALPSLAAQARIDFTGGSAPIAFAVDDVERALGSRNESVERRDLRVPAPAAETQPDLVVHIALIEPSNDSTSPHLEPEGFILRSARDGAVRRLTVLALDAGGAMYGGLELAEQIRVRGPDDIVDMVRNPYLPLRGTKFNLPLDLRTPSYSDMSDSAQQNIETIWDFEFWRAYLDRLARDRYNMVSLWNLHPFPSMVKVPGYPKIALDDVWRSKIAFDEDYSTRTTDIVTPAMLANHEVLKRLTIDQKIDFWRRVMQYAKDRNIAIYVFTWNVYTYGTGGQYGITDAIDNPKTTAKINSIPSIAVFKMIKPGIIHRQRIGIVA